MKKRLVDYPRYVDRDKWTMVSEDDRVIPLSVCEAHGKVDAAKDEVVKQLNNIKLLWDGGYIKATDDGLLRVETVEKAWEALAKLEAITDE